MTEQEFRALAADDALARLEQGSDFPRIDADEVRRMFDAYEREIKTLREQVKS